ELELELPARPEAERLVFGSWKLAGFEDAWELWGDREVTRLIGGPWERDEVRARVATEMLSEREHGVQYWPISTRRGAFVGACGLTVNDHGEHELGFHLCHRAWGQGFAREAAQAVIVFAFGTLGLMRLVAGHHPDNAASARMLEKLEFRYVGDRFYAPTGLHHPHYERVRRGVAVER
ncbi:MAG: GNAT family N-acetyltransferase, partial [Proteobacteria bacterium]|nr:GNAT family N-acetyltransferase [Pseudomonadota bacterium]